MQSGLYTGLCMKLLPPSQTAPPSWIKKSGSRRAYIPGWKSVAFLSCGPENQIPQSAIIFSNGFTIKHPLAPLQLKKGRVFVPRFLFLRKGPRVSVGFGAAQENMQAGILSDAATSPKPNLTLHERSPVARAALPRRCETFRRPPIPRGRGP